MSMIPLAFSPALFPSSLSRSSVQTSYKREGGRDKQSEKKILYKKNREWCGEEALHADTLSNTEREEKKTHHKRERERY